VKPPARAKIHLLDNPVADLVFILRPLQERVRGHVALVELELNVLENAHRHAQQIGIDW
jgi:hypothetical protein